MKYLVVAAGLLAITTVWLGAREPATVRAQSPTLTHSVQCEADKVIMDGQLTCSFTLENTSDMTLTELSASVSLGECVDPEPCIIGVIGVVGGLFPVDSEPPWTGITGQYGFPFWDPLGSGVLLPGESTTVRVTLEAVDDEYPRQLFCGGGSAVADTGGTGTPTPVSSEPFSERCVEVRIVDSLPAVATATPPATHPAPTAAAAVLPSTGSDGGAGSAGTNPLLLAVLTAMGSALIATATFLTLRRGKK